MPGEEPRHQDILAVLVGLLRRHVLLDWKYGLVSNSDPQYYASDYQQFSIQERVTCGSGVANSVERKREIYLSRVVNINHFKSCVSVLIEALKVFKYF